MQAWLFLTRKPPKEIKKDAAFQQNQQSPDQDFSQYLHSTKKDGFFVEQQTPKTVGEKREERWVKKTELFFPLLFHNSNVFAIYIYKWATKCNMHEYIIYKNI